MSDRSKRAAWLLLAAAIAALDLWSKQLWTYPVVEETGKPVLGAAMHQQYVFESWLAMTTTWNPGAVWGLKIASTFLKWATAIAIPLVAIWVFVPPRSRRWETAAKCLILGGAIGNFYDRFRWGAVRDWIDMYFGGKGGWHWPTYNVADMALVGGIGVLLLLSYTKKESVE